MTRLEGHLNLYPHVENVFKGTEIIGFFKIKAAIRNLLSEMPITKARRIVEAARPFPLNDALVELFIEHSNTDTATLASSPTENESE